MKDNYLEIKKISNFIKLNEYEDISWNLIEKFLNLIVDNTTIKYLNDSSLNNTARYVPSNRTIYINYYRMLNYLERNILSYRKEMNDNDYETSPIYFLIHTLLHEVAHAKQYMMGKREIPVVDEFLANTYKYLYDFIIYSDPKSLSYAKYRENENFYILERNAELESLHKMISVLKNGKNDSVNNIFKRIYKLYLQCGYYDNSYGNIYETFDGMNLVNDYLNIYVESDLSEKDRAFYGLPIKEATRKKILEK